MRRALTMLAATGALAALGGCGGGGGDGKSASAQKVETTRVQVVEGVGSKGSNFDPDQIYRRLSPGVVTVISLFGQGNSLLGDGGGEGGQGSGFVLDGQGYIATNAHVVTSGAQNTRRAKQVFVEFSSGDRVPAKVIGVDLNSDVSLLKVNPKGLKLTPLGLGRSSHLRVGAPVAAIGSPFGERQSLSVGVISALDRNIESLTRFQIGNAIQTDAAINPGNSGGPLLSRSGRVLGINAQIKSQSGGGEGVGFAIPIDTIRRSLRELRAKGRVDYAFLGVTTLLLYPQLAERLNLDVREGAVVSQVESGSPADDAGLKAGAKKITFQAQREVPEGGDVIVAVNGKKLNSRDDLADVVSALPAGKDVELDVVRGNDRRTVKVKLGKRPSRAPAN